ncbi:MAG TPA: response regulator [Aggregatilineales bacterium]|nr:response regulator [Aggregatilineales bacterium]
MTGKRALIIDDDPANRSIWELVLTDRGYEVLSASDAASSLEQLNDSITLYLVDYHLPDIPGAELVSQIRDSYPSSVVVMVSMDDDADVIRESLHAGGNVFMVKPSSPSVMAQVLSEIESGDIGVNARQLINRHGRRNYTL